MSKRIAERALVFAHYSRARSLSSNVIDALHAYARHMDVIVFVSASPLPPGGRDRLPAMCCEIIERPNIGYDFCSWKAGVDALGPIANLDEIIIANDSVIGPLADCSAMIAALRDDPRDVCGLTVGWEFDRHVQSYFVRFSEATLRSGAFSAFWEQVAPLNDKQDIIERYEIGMSALMEAAGHSTGALFEPPLAPGLTARVARWMMDGDHSGPMAAYRSLQRITKMPALNPMLYMWRECLDAGLPFLKKELIRDNPTAQNLSRVFREARRRFGIKPDELQRLARE